MASLPRLKNIMNISLYALGWIVCLLGQMLGSIRSRSNGLTYDFAGMWKWLLIQPDKLLYRAFFSTVLYPIVLKLFISKVSPPLQAMGLEGAVWTFAALAGFSSNNLIYQVLGLVPGMRAEIPELAPTEDLKARIAAGVAPEPPK